jgi:excinuclease ABC subunit C
MKTLHKNVLEPLEILELLKLHNADRAKAALANKEELANLVDQGTTNAFVYLQRVKKNHKLNLIEENSIYTTVVNLQKELGLKNVPKRMECYDISHLSGKYVYGSMVVFINGRADKKLYRIFKTIDRNDDYKNHQEVLMRRLTHVHELGWELPDLIIVDGGKGQLSSDAQVLNQVGLLGTIDIISLAKKEEEIFTLQHLIDKSEHGEKLTPECNFLLERIRDEAHRFAITANRKKRLKSITKTSLDGISGLGPLTIKKIMETFGSMQEFQKNLDKNPTLIEKLIGESKTNLIKNYFKTKTQPL